MIKHCINNKINSIKPQNDKFYSYLIDNRNVKPVEFELITFDTNLTSIDFLSQPIEHHTQTK